MRSVIPDMWIHPNIHNQGAWILVHQLCAKNKDYQGDTGHGKYRQSKHKDYAPAFCMKENAC